MKITCPRLVRKMAAKYITKLISEEAGIDIDIAIYDLSIDTKGDKYRISTGCWIDVKKKDLKRIIKEL